jgi:hypothetical protein
MMKRGKIIKRKGNMKGKQPKTNLLIFERKTWTSVEHFGKR